LDELGLPLDRDLAAIKLQVLEEVSAGRLSEAVRLAIVAAGKSVGAAATEPCTIPRRFLGS
jgi:hypothetical protein